MSRYFWDNRDEYSQKTQKIADLMFSGRGLYQLTIVYKSGDFLKLTRNKMTFESMVTQNGQQVLDYDDSLQNKGRFRDFLMTSLLNDGPSVLTLVGGTRTKMELYFS